MAAKNMSDTSTLDRCLIDVDRRAFAIWDSVQNNRFIWDVSIGV